MGSVTLNRARSAPSFPGTIGAIGSRPAVVLRGFCRTERPSCHMPPTASGKSPAYCLTTTPPFMTKLTARAASDRPADRPAPRSGPPVRGHGPDTVTPPQEIGGSGSRSGLPPSVASPGDVVAELLRVLAMRACRVGAEGDLHAMLSRELEGRFVSLHDLGQLVDDDFR